MHLNILVDLPDIPGKIVIQKKKNASYVHYEYDRVYDPVRKFNVPKRVVIGKLSQSDDRKMYPNPKFLKYFPAAYISSSTVDSSRSCSLKIGSWMAIRSIIAQYGLWRIIGDIVGKDAGLFLDLAAYSIVS